MRVIVRRRISSSQRFQKRSILLPRDLPDEHTLIIEINGVRQAVLICTADQLPELATGWALANGVQFGANTPPEVDRGERVSIARMVAEPEPNFKWKDYVVAGFDAGVLIPGEVSPIAGESGMTSEAFEGLLQSVFDEFRKYRGIGGSHNAALANAQGILHLSTDISRHNAVDKVIGAAHLRGTDVSNTFLVLSGRISADIAAKCARAGIPIVASRSIPTVQAAEIAEQCGMMLICRALDNRRFTIGPHRLHE